MPLAESIFVFLSSFSLIALAEIGDKSQLVCMTLAARHRHRTVTLCGSSNIYHTQCAGSLNRCGSRDLTIRKVIAGVVAVLFGALGISARFEKD